MSQFPHLKMVSAYQLLLLLTEYEIELKSQVTLYQEIGEGFMKAFELEMALKNGWYVYVWRSSERVWLQGELLPA